MITFDQFKTKYLGKQVEYHSYDPAAKFQCVDLANQYIVEVLGLTAVIGTHAKDFPLKISKLQFDVLINTDMFVPKKGDVAVWDGDAGGGFGHIAVVSDESATLSRFNSLDQNWSKPLFVTLESHTYTNVSHFLRAKVLSTPEPMPETPAPSKVLEHYNVKTDEELIKMVDSQLSFLEEARKRVTELESINRDHATHLEELAGKLGTIVDYSAILAETTELLRVEEVKRKIERQLEDEKIDHNKDVADLLVRVGDLRAAVEKQQKENEQLLVRLETLENQATQQQEKQESLNILKSFVDQLTKLFERK